MEGMILHRVFVFIVMKGMIVTCGTQQKESLCPLYLADRFVQQTSSSHDNSNAPFTHHLSTLLRSYDL